MCRDASLSQSIARLLCLERHRSICLQGGREIRERGVQLHNSFLESVIVVAATGWLLSTKFGACNSSTTQIHLFAMRIQSICA
jgi:hypothetical protein